MTTHYNVFLGDFFPPKGRKFVGDENGMVQVKIQNGWTDRCHLSPSAEGYARGFYVTPAGSHIAPMSAASHNGAEGPTIDILWRHGRGQPFPKTLVAELWKEPSPYFTVIIPNDYRGPLKIALDPFTVRDLAPGERTVIVHADDHGMVSAPLTRPIFFSYSAEEPAYRFGSGAEIPKAFPVYTRANFVIHGPATTKPVVRDDAIAIRRVEGRIVVGDAKNALTTRPAR